MSDKLETLIKSEITANGPMRLDYFMGLALGHPQYGYYTTRDPFGVDGDFITAPEISQIFGEIIGIWCAQQWLRLGSPAKCHLIEIGPGRGTLMADALRGSKHVAGFHDSLSVHLVETSPTLIQRQRQILIPYSSVSWHNHINDIQTDGAPAIVIANEFFDALPIRQFKFQGTSWHEHFITVDDDGNFQTTWRETNKKFERDTPAKDGDIIETSPAQTNYANDIKTTISPNGAALIIDYGYIGDFYGDTLQALYKHKPCPPLHNIGQADLTTHVDFVRLSEIFGAHETALSTQAAFLHNYGGSIRLQSLLEKHPDNAATLQNSYARLTDTSAATGMGRLFKALEIFNSNL